MNKKYVRHLLLFQGIGVLLFITIYIFDRFNIIDIYDYLINGIIYAVSAIFCICNYAYIYSTYINRLNTKMECITAGAMFAISVIEIPIALPVAGIHTGILAIWAGTNMSITVYTIIWYLRALEENVFVTQRKYLHLITYLKTWANAVFIGEFFFGALFIFYPTAFSSL